MLLIVLRWSCLFCSYFQLALSWLQGLLSKFQIVQKPDPVRPVAKSLLQPRRLLHRSRSLPLLNKNSVTISTLCLFLSAFMSFVIVIVVVFVFAFSFVFFYPVCYRDIKKVFLLLYCSSLDHILLILFCLVCLLVMSRHSCSRSKRDSLNIRGGSNVAISELCASQVCCSIHAEETIQTD